MKIVFFDAYGALIVRDWNTLDVEIIKRRIKNEKIVIHFEELKKTFLERIEKENKEVSNGEETKTVPYCEDE